MTIRYSCPFRSPAGEVRDVVVELGPNEVSDVMRHRAEGRAAGAPGGPLERGYAWHRAVKTVPAEFTPLFDQDRCITAVN
jgi:hypothetical protein